MKLTCTQKQLLTSTLMSSFDKCSDFIMIITFISTHIYSTLKTHLVTNSLAEWIDIIFTSFLEAVIEIFPKWDLNLQSPSFVQMLWVRSQALSSTCTQPNLYSLSSYTFDSVFRFHFSFWLWLYIYIYCYMKIIKLSNFKSIYLVLRKWALKVLYAKIFGVKRSI